MVPEISRLSPAPVKTYFWFLLAMDTGMMITPYHATETQIRRKKTGPPKKRAAVARQVRGTKRAKRSLDSQSRACPGESAVDQSRKQSKKYPSAPTVHSVSFYFFKV